MTAADEALTWFPCDQARADRIFAALIAEADACTESDPARAFACRADAHSLMRLRFAVRPIPYRPAPKECAPISDTVLALVQDYATGLWPHPQLAADEEVPA